MWLDLIETWDLRPLPGGGWGRIFGVPKDWALSRPLSGDRRHLQLPRQTGPSPALARRRARLEAVELADTIAAYQRRGITPPAWLTRAWRAARLAAVSP